MAHDSCSNHNAQELARASVPITDHLERIDSSQAKKKKTLSEHGMTSGRQFPGVVK